MPFSLRIDDIPSQETPVGAPDVALSGDVDYQPSAFGGTTTVLVGGTAIRCLSLLQFRKQTRTSRTESSAYREESYVYLETST